MICDGWLATAKKIESPYFNSRPDEKNISLLVIHSISLPPAQFLGHFVEDYFVGKLEISQHSYFEQIADLKVSCHLYIRRNGDLIQFVALDKRAWHAGSSWFEGRDNCNDFSIGIELEGTDNIAYTDRQYSTLLNTTQDIRKIYPLITSQRIVGHCDIAPERKTDPGQSFDWQRFFSSI